MKTRLLALAASALLAAPLAAQGAVLVVDSTDAGAFPTLQAAIDVASDGDVLLVRGPGSPSFALEGKSLVIQADAGSAPLVGGGLPPGFVAPSIIRDLPAGGVVVVRGLQLVGLEILDVAGLVWLEDCETFGFAPSLRSANCARLVIEHAVLTGPDVVDDLYFPQAGGRGAELIDTVAWLHDVGLEGGDGIDFHCNAFGNCWNSAGFDALLVGGESEVRLFDVRARGGDGGAGGVDFFDFCHPGGAGGHALRLQGGSPLVLSLNVALEGGLGGLGPAPGTCLFGATGDGPKGLPSAVFDGTFGWAEGPFDTLSANSPVREAEPVSVAIAGSAGETVALLLSPQPALAMVGALEGLLLAQPPITVLFLGALPGSGELSVSGLVPELGPGFESVSFVVQLVGQTQPGVWTAGSASAGVLLDEGL